MPPTCYVGVGAPRLAPAKMISSEPAVWFTSRASLQVVTLLAVLLLTAAGFIARGWWWISNRAANEGGMGSVGYDVSRPWIGFPVLTIIGLIFSAGFYWEFRRAKRANRPPR